MEPGIMSVHRLCLGERGDQNEAGVSGDGAGTGGEGQSQLPNQDRHSL